MLELYVGIYLVGVLVSSVSQVLLKKAAMRQYETPLKEYLNPWVITAYTLFFGAPPMTLLAYKVVPLSMGAILAALRRRRSRSRHQLREELRPA